MGYCNRYDIQNIIAQALTSATASNYQNLDGSIDSQVPLLYVGNTFDKNLVTNSIIDSYIKMADQKIDSSLSQLYKTPLTEKIDLDTTLYSNIDEYNEYIVLDKYFPIITGDTVIVSQNSVQERHIVDQIVSDTVFSTESIIGYAFETGARVVRVGYPMPIRYISARYAAANLYDKYFASEASPNMSEYGNKMREIANNDLNLILSGVNILHGQHRIGRRFYNSNLSDQYGLPDINQIIK